MIDLARIAAWALLGVCVGLVVNCLLVSALEILAPRRGRIVRLAKARLHAEVRGQGIPVLYLHGAQSSGREFAIGAAQFLEEGFLHVLMDRPGHGHSSRVRGQESLAVQAEYAAKLLEHLEIKRAVIAAHAEGAAVALRLALERPELVRALVLVAPLIHPRTRRDGARMAPAWLVWLWAHTLAPWAWLAGTGLRLRAKFSPQPPAPKFAARSQDGLGARPSAWLANWRARGRFSSECALQALRYPQIGAYALILSPDRDAFADPQENGRALYGALPRAELVMAPGMGHMLHHVRAQAVAAAIRRAASLEQRPAPR